MLQQENGDRIDMANMPRPRRKREKKLMSMDEVNERFPLIKYKVWRAGREQSGLPAAGGITAPPSRAPSIREHNDLKRVSTELTRNADRENPTRSSNEHATSRPVSATDGVNEHHSHPRHISSSSTEKAPQIRVEEHNSVDAEGPATSAGIDEEEEEEDTIRAPGVPAALANTPGDQCAICIETLEDDDEVRGLTCGHAFHAGCLDPWLTSRRACCPLCKADYYIPKPRPDGSRTNNDPTSSANLPQTPEQAHRPRFNIGGTPFILHHHDRYGFPVLVRDRPSRQSRRQRQSSSQSVAETPEDQRTAHRRTNFIRSLPSRIPAPRIPRFGQRANSQPQSGANDSITPHQLESGTR